MLRSLFLPFLATLLVACAAATTSASSTAPTVGGEVAPVTAVEHHDDAIDDLSDGPVEQIEASPDQLRAAALGLGVRPEDVVYEDVLPFVVSDEEAELDYAFIELDDDGSILVTRLDPATAEPLSVRQPPEPYVEDFVRDVVLADADPLKTIGTTPGTYDCFPTCWRTPLVSMPSVYMTCGYGCSSGHQRSDWAAVDLAPPGGGGAGKPVAAPASCWAMFAGWQNGYGYTVVLECGASSGGRRFYTRIAHLQSKPIITPGWWIAEGRTIGYLGSTGTSSAPHVHWATTDGTFSGGYVTGNGVPISRWPISTVSVCGSKYASRTFTSYQHIGAIQANGCP